MDFNMQGFIKEWPGFKSCGREEGNRNRKRGKSSCEASSSAYIAINAMCILTTPKILTFQPRTVL